MPLRVMFFVCALFTVQCSYGTPKCHELGSDAQVKKFIQELKEASDHPSDFSELVRYPVRVYSKNGKVVVVDDPKTFQKYYNEIIPDTTRREIQNTTFSGLFCNYKGGHVGRGHVWFRRQKSGRILVTAIHNAVEFKAKADDFVGIKPLDQTEVKKFLAMIDLQTQKKMYMNLEVDKVTFGQESFSIGSGKYRLYFEDVNNDGKKEYLLVYVHSGSGNYSGVQDAFVLRNGKLVSLRLDDIIVSNLFLGDMSRFHSFLDDPFVVKRKGQILLRFHDGSGTKTYFWKGKTFKQVP